VPEASRGRSLKTERVDVTVNVRKSGEIIVAGGTMTPVELGSLLKQRSSAAGEAGIRVHVRGDESTPFGEVTMKIAELPGGRRKASPEYEDCARLAREAGVSTAEVAEAARAAWREEERG